jgi:hypothetical protein
MSDETALLSRRGLLTGAAAFGAVAAVGVVGAEPAAAATATAIVRIVNQQRATTWRYNATTRVTTVLRYTTVRVTARFYAGKIYLKSSTGVWTQIPYIYSATRKALVFSRYLQLQMMAAAQAAAAAKSPTSGVHVIKPAAYATTSGYITTDWARHLLRRAAYGPTAGDLASVTALGYAAWLERQITPSVIDDTYCNTILKRLPDQGTPIWRVKHGISDGTINGWEQFQSVLTDHAVRAMWSKRQLLTVMEDFWGNHFNVTIYADGTAESRAHYAYTIRTRAFGKFSELLKAITKHPAMLTYLNNRESTAAHPNENQGRELLELHSVGVETGYGEIGVLNSARILTGLGVDSDSGHYAYQPWNHWRGPVKVLGFSHANATDTGGEAVVDAYVTYLARHPATAKRLARKLATRFVSDNPSAALVNLLASVYLKNDTAIAPVLRVLFSSAEFARSMGSKVARPYEHIVSVARLMGISPAPNNLDAPLQLNWMADNAGHNPFGQPFPTGQPDTADAWESTATTLTRWNNALSVVAGWTPSDVVRRPLIEVAVGPTLPTTHGALVDKVATNLFGRVLPASHKAAMLTFLGVTADQAVSSSSGAVSWNLANFVGVLMDSPYQTLR